jgi:type IV fimbrial biogenesis protein FimT
MNNCNRGFTLIELMLVIVILSITLWIGLPSMGNLVEQTYRKTSLNNLISGLHLARTSAIFEQTHVTLCPLDAENRCVRDWRQPVSIFRDPKRQRQLTSSDALIRVIAPPKRGNLKGRTGIRRHFGFTPSGMAKDAIGHILWCPDDGDATQAYQLLINMGGRLRIARDRDSNGIVEGSNGKDVSCT